MNRIDTEKLLKEHPIDEVIGRHVLLKKNGPHYKGTCPFHDDKHASLTVTPNKNLAKCFACGWSGDSIAFMMDLKGVSFKEACEALGDTTAADTSNAKQRITKPKKEIQWQQRDVPNEPYTGDFEHYRHGKPSKIWTYHLSNGTVTGYVCRFDFPDGEKEVLPFVWATNGNRSEWRYMGFAAPRPLYNLHLIERYPDATVLVVEGEKTADAAQAQLAPERTVVTTWTGGTNAIQHVDWLTIKQRKKILLPDNDIQGLSAMLHVKHLIGANKIVPLDSTLPKGWDVADKEWQPGELRQWVLERVVDDIPANAGENLWKFQQIGRESVYQFGIVHGKWTLQEQKVAEPPIPEPPMPEPSAPEPTEPEYPYTPPPVTEKTEEEHDSYFKFLGYDKAENGQQAYYFLAKGSHQVIRLMPSSISSNTLLQLAPLAFWQERFIGKKPFDVTAAINWIVNTSNHVGPFKDKYIRGRGAWMDAGRVVIHAGDKLIVNGSNMRIGDFKSRYIYEIDEELGFEQVNALRPKDAIKLLDLIKMLNWERDINPYLLAGWCVIAPVCGALTWRPHIWLTGAAGTGKSWVFNKVIRRLLAATAMSVQGETSEAGLRQLLKHDALPVVFDEAEGADKKAHDRMQQVMALMRASSAEDGGVMAKGTAGGSAKTYRIRSCFAFASIAVQISQQSDRTRVTVLGLKRYIAPDKKERWEHIQRVYNDTLNDEYVAALQARTIGLLPTILRNAETFANAAAAELGAQRTGDQLGALLAGAYSLHSDKVISFDDAVKWVREKDWSEERGLDRSADELQMLEHMLNQITTVDSLSGKYERTVGELIEIAVGRRSEDAVSADVAHDRLKRLGFKHKDGMLYVSNTADWIRKVLKDTPWPQNHNKVLQRIEGSQKIESTRFSAGLETRAVAVPLGVVFGEPIKKEEDMPF